MLFNDWRQAQIEAEKRQGRFSRAPMRAPRVPRQREAGAIAALNAWRHRLAARGEGSSGVGRAKLRSIAYGPMVCLANLFSGSEV